MDSKKANKIVEKIDGWKTVIGAIGTPIAAALVATLPAHTLGYKISIGFSAAFGATGIAGVIHKFLKKELPNQNKELKDLPEGLRKEN